MADTEDPVLFARRIGVRYPLAVALEDLRQKFGRIEGLPTTMLYDSRGILRSKIIGFEYASVIESHLKSTSVNADDRCCRKHWVTSVFDVTHGTRHNLRS